MESKITNTNFFIDAQAREEIDNYLRTNIKSIMNQQYREFMPVVMEKIEHILDRWLFELQETAKKKDFTLKLNNNLFLRAGTSYHEAKWEGPFYLDATARSLVYKILCRKTGVKAEEISVNYSREHEGTNYLLPGVLPNGNGFAFQCYWSPQNASIYREKIAAKRYQPQPNLAGKANWELAQQGVQTDITFINQEGERLPAHSLFFKLKSDYFEGMLQSGLKEANSGEVRLNCSSVNTKNLLLFIYTGEISSETHQNLGELAELLDLSHTMRIDDLTDHCVDLILDCFRKDGLTQESIPEFIQRDFVFNIKDFLLPCLQAAEIFFSAESNNSGENKEESENDQMIDFSKMGLLSSQYAELLVLAVEHGLTNVKAPLLAAIRLLDQTASKESAVSGELKLTEPTKETIKGKEKEHETDREPQVA